MFEAPPEASRFEEMLQKAVKGFKDLCLVRAALEMGVFRHLDEPSDIETLARQWGVNRRLLRLFLENLSRLGLLRREGGYYTVTALSRRFLDPRSPYCQLRHLKHEIDSALRWLDLSRCLGGISRHEKVSFFGEIVHVLAEQRMLGELQETLEILCDLDGFKRAQRCLDLGGGHGLFAMAFTKAKEDLEAYVFDLPQVLEETKDYIAKYHAERVYLVAGDFFRDELGSDYDLVFSAYNPAGKRPEVIPKIWRCLREGGTYINQQFFPEDDPATVEDLEWNLWDFGMEKGPKAYTFEGDLDLSGYLNALRKEGFKVERVINMKRGDKMIVAQKG